MMQLKKAMLEIVRGDGGGVLFEAPPQGNPRISAAHAGQLAERCEQIRGVSGRWSRSPVRRTGWGITVASR